MSVRGESCSTGVVLTLELLLPAVPENAEEGDCSAARKGSKTKARHHTPLQNDLMEIVDVAFPEGTYEQVAAQFNFSEVLLPELEVLRKRKATLKGMYLEMKLQQMQGFLAHDKFLEMLHDINAYKYNVFSVEQCISKLLLDELQDAQALNDALERQDA
eukprot:446701-Rhodomonas_salina.3